LLQSTYTVVSGNHILSPTITSATFSGPSAGNLALVEGSVIEGNHVRNTASPMTINFSSADTLRIAQNYVMGAGTSDTSINSLTFASNDIPSIAYPTQSFRAGNVAFNLSATTGEPIGWLCTASGTSGTWIPIGTFITGSGSPEGNITAPIASLYTNTSGGASTTLYVKTSGTGNTGWTAK
jgi:hypothetical protein